MQSMHHLLYVTEREREAIGTDTETGERGGGRETERKSFKDTWRVREREREQKRTGRERMRLMQIIALQSITRACAIETKKLGKARAMAYFY